MGSSVLSDVRPDERRSAAGAFLTLFGVLAAHTMLETARDALFLARLPPSQLPWVYLAMALAAIAIAPRPRAARRRGHLRRYALPLLLLSCALVTFGFWALGSFSQPWVLRALYLWTGLVGTLTALQFWLVLGEIYTITQAKRLYRLIGAGSVLGAVAGAGVARELSERAPAQHLVLAAAIVLALTAVGPTLLLRRPSGTSAMPEARGRSWQISEMWRGHPYVTRLAGLVLISTVALTLADYVFKSVVARLIPAEDLGTFFATFYMALNLLALVTQFLLTGWLLRTIGLHRSLWLLPALVMVGAAGVVFSGSLLAALLLKGADGSLRHSLHRTGTELLFLPMADSMRSRTKPLIDVFGQRGGQALASIFILAQISLGRGEVWLAAAAALLCVAWIASAADLRTHYLELFRTALREGTMRREADAPELDLHSLEALFGALNSRDDVEVVAALDLLAEEGRVRLIPALILYHPSKAVVLRALDLLARSGRRDFLPVAERILDHPDAEVRAAALRARTAAEPDEGVLRTAMTDPSPLVRASAVVGLVSGGWITEEAQDALDALLDPHFPEAPRALARAIRQQPSPAFASLLHQLAQSSDPVVLRHVAAAMGALQDPGFLPALLPLLGSHEARQATREALLAFGDPALEFLDRTLGDYGMPHDIRRHLPRTISRFPAAQAGAILLRHLASEQDGMVRFKILRGLGRLAHDNPDLELDATVLSAATQRTVAAAFRLVHWRSLLAREVELNPHWATPGHELLSSMLRDKEAHTIERVFRLLALQYRSEDLERMYHALKSANPKVRASSRELLENLLQPPLRQAVLALIDDVSGLERLAGGAPFYAPEISSHQELLAALLEQPGETLRCLAAYHVGEVGLVALQPQLQRFLSEGTGLFVARVIERALQRLSEPNPRLAHA